MFWLLHGNLTTTNLKWQWITGWDKWLASKGDDVFCLLATEVSRLRWKLMIRIGLKILIKAEQPSIRCLFVVPFQFCFVEAKKWHYLGNTWSVLLDFKVVKNFWSALTYCTTYFQFLYIDFNIEFWEWYHKKVLPNQLNTLFKDNLLSQFYFPGLFSLLHIHTWWGQSKYVRKFEISQANFEKTWNLFILNFMY